MRALVRTIRARTLSQSRVSFKKIQFTLYLSISVCKKTSATNSSGVLLTFLLKPSLPAACPWASETLDTKGLHMTGRVGRLSWECNVGRLSWECNVGRLSWKRFLMLALPLLSRFGLTNPLFYSCPAIMIFFLFFFSFLLSFFLSCLCFAE